MDFEQRRKKAGWNPEGGVIASYPFLFSPG